MTLLDDRLHDTVTTMLHAAPEPRDFASLQVPRNLPEPTRPPTRRRHLVAAAVALVVVAAIVVTVAVVRSQRADRSVPAGSVAVTHEVLRYVQIPDTECRARESGTRGFDQVTTDVWKRADGTAQRLISAYPDGSRFEMLAFGRDLEQPMPRYDRLYVKGLRRSRVTSCGLNNGPALAPDDLLGSLAGLRKLRNYRYGTRSNDGRHDIWQSDTAGGSTAPDGTPIAESKDRSVFVVDPASGDVLERTLASDLGDFGRVFRDLKSARYETTTVPEDFFGTAGFRRVDSGGATTTTLGGGS